MITLVNKEEYFKISFTHNDKTKKAIISTKPLEKKKDNCYFEVEILEMNPGVEIAIGLCHKNHFDKATFPGEKNHSVGFFSKEGAIYLNGEKLYTNEINPGFGDTMG